MTFVFDELVWVTKAGAKPEDIHPDDQADIDWLRSALPELAHWGDLAIMGAFGAYSEACQAISWTDWAIGRPELSGHFLGYVYGVQTGAIAKGGNCGLDDAEAERIAAQRPWAEEKP